MAEAVETVEGWWVQHDFRRLDWTKWRQATPVERKAVWDEMAAVWSDWSDVAQNGGGSFGFFATFGHKADLCILNFRTQLDELLVCQQRLNRGRFREFFDPAWSYLSVVELSGYVAQHLAPDSPELKLRLHPAVPDKRYVCFYPMTKRRQGDDNWYRLEASERREMMKRHGMIGRGYAGRVVQIITGSQGLDDWEWGVTLFADDPLEFKKIVYEMRFDEVSARFSDFGSFIVGMRLTEAALRKFFTV